MKKILVALAATIGWAGQLAGAAPIGTSDEAFAKIADSFMDGYLAWRPQLAVSLGLHEYDGRMTDYSAASLASEHARLQSFERQLAALDHAALSPVARHRCRLLETAVEGELFSFDDMHAYTLNPMTYAEAVDVNVYLKRNFAPLANRVRSIVSVEQALPALFAAARANLAPALPKPYVELAIEIADGGADFLAKDLVEAVAGLTDAKLAAEFKAANDQAIAELRGYVAWLKETRLPKANAPYALGREKYQRMLRSGELIDLPPERILEIGLRELKRQQAQFAAAAHVIDPTKTPVEVFKAIQHDHPTETGLIPDVRKHLDAIRDFIVARDLITIPSEVRAQAKETPQFLRAGSFASMDTPGPFEKAAEAYYYVTPTEASWTAQQKDEWLTSFNYYTADVVSIHEAYPGHYVQFLKLNGSKVGRIEKIFSSYAFTEGWAHYSEQMLLDEGFGADGDPVRAAKYRLAQADEALLRICRLCVSVQMHCNGMDVDQATKFFEENCYYEPKPSHQEALRGTFDPGYLYYTIGKLEFLKLRRDWQAQEGAAFSLKRFHDEALRHGMPPLRLLREIMLKDPTTWDAIF